MRRKKQRVERSQLVFIKQGIWFLSTGFLCALGTLGVSTDGQAIGCSMVPGAGVDSKKVACLQISRCALLTTGSTRSGRTSCRRSSRTSRLRSGHRFQYIVCGTRHTSWSGGPMLSQHLRQSSWSSSLSLSPFVVVVGITGSQSPSCSSSLPHLIIVIIRWSSSPTSSSWFHHLHLIPPSSYLRHQHPRCQHRHAHAHLHRHRHHHCRPQHNHHHLYRHGHYQEHYRQFPKHHQHQHHNSNLSPSWGLSSSLPPPTF